MSDRSTYYQNNCAGESVAYLFNLHPHRIPCFARNRNKWFPRLKAFFRRRGYRLSCYYYAKMKHTLRADRLYLVQGISPRETSGQHHMVVYKGTRRHWDSAPERDFLKGRPLYVFIATRIKE